LFSDQGLVTQIHDYNPGVSAQGVFWTIAVPDAIVLVNPGAGRATFSVSNVSIADYGNVVNALTGRSGVPALVSFEVQWRKVLSRINIRNDEIGFAGLYVHNTAILKWSSSQAGFAFDANPFDSAVNPGFALVGKTRNGAFF
jgi:hypothetical protein